MSPSLMKVCPPDLDGVVARGRLFQALDDAQRRPIVWVCGPGGAGKTTLVGSYIAARELPVVWYTLDLRDNDPATFFYFFRFAVERVFPEVAAELPLLSPEYRPRLDAFALRYFERLYAALPRPAWIVLDDTHVIDAASPLQGTLRDGLARLPDGVHLAVVGRGPLPLGLSRHRANRRVASLSEHDLKLSEDEVAGLVRRDEPSDAPAATPEVVRALCRLSDGWAAGAVLLREWMRSTGATPEALDAQIPDSLFDYFAAEVFQSSPPRMRRFLLETAVLQTITPALARDLTGDDEAGAQLGALHRDHFFTERQPTDGGSYRYHPLFRTFLLERGRSELTPPEREGLERRAVKALVAHERLEEAVELAAAVDDVETLIGLILRQAPSLAGQGRFQTLADWLRLLPEPVATTNGWAIFWRGVATLNIRPRDGPPLLKAAWDRFRELGDDVGAYCACAAWVESVPMVGTEARGFDEAIEFVEQLAREEPTFPSQDIELRVASAAVIALLWRRPEHPDLPSWVERVTRLARGWPDPMRRIGAALYVVIYHFERGDLQAADDALHGVVGDVSDASPLLRGWRAHIAAIFWFWRGELERARSIASDGLEMTRAAGLDTFDRWLTGTRVMAELGAGELERAEAGLAEMAEGVELRPPHEATYYHYVATWAALERGHPIEARAQHTLWSGKHEAAGYRLNQALEAAAGAQVHIELGELEAAEVELDRCLGLARARQSKSWEFLAGLVRADLRLRQGARDEARRVLTETLAVGRSSGLVVVPLWRPRIVARLCVEALEAGIEVDYVTHLVRTLGMVADPPPRHLDAWPWPLRIRTLGQLTVERDGRPLPLGRKAPRRQLELLAALIAFGGLRVPHQRLSDALWPEADGDAAYRSFAATLHRLRQLLGDPDALTVEAGEVTLNPARCWVDVWALEDLLDGVRPSEGYEDGDARATGEAATRLLSLYGGEFLAGFTAHWVIPVRGGTFARFRAGAEALGGRLEAHAEREAARQLYERAASLALDERDRESLLRRAAAALPETRD